MMHEPFENRLKHTMRSVSPMVVGRKKSKKKSVERQDFVKDVIANSCAGRIF